MRRRRGLGAGGAAALLVVALGMVGLGGVAAPGRAAASAGVPKAVDGAPIVARVRAGMDALRVAAPHPAGYERRAFRTWDDADHDCRDTRAEVLVAESTRPTTGGCTIRTGRWLSWYDDRTFTTASSLDVDHLVPLEEVWASGGRAWSAARREAYANDLTEHRTLVAVSAHANRSKGDRDPAGWMPVDHRCRYLYSWVAVKLRWDLAVNRAEKNALITIAQGCTNVVLHTHHARVVLAGSGGSGGAGGSGGSGGSHACTRTSSGSCIRAGEFCKQADYGSTGYDAHGRRLTCTGSRTHPRWSA